MGWLTCCTTIWFVLQYVWQCSLLSIPYQRLTIPGYTFTITNIWTQHFGNGEVDREPFDIHIDKSFHAIFKKINWHPVKISIFSRFFYIFWCCFGVILHEATGRKRNIWIPWYLFNCSQFTIHLPTQVICQTCSGTIQTPLKHPHFWSAWGHWEKEKYLNIMIST